MEHVELIRVGITGSITAALDNLGPSLSVLK